jgi:hypothetical protein
VPGATVNSAGPQVINTPNSSTGQPAFQDPSATGWSTEFATPQGGQLTTTTPNSRTGAPAPGIRNLPAPTSGPVPGWVSPAASLLGRGGLWGLGGYLMGKTIEPQPLNAGEDEVLKRFQPAPNTTIGTQTDSAPVTQTGPRPQFGPPLPPGGIPPVAPPNGPQAVILPVTPQLAIPPFNVHPGARAPTVQPRGALAQPGGPTQPGAAPPSAPAMVDLGYYRPTVGNARGSPTWAPQGMDNPAPQIFRGPQTAYGAPLTGSGPRGAQNYYIPGSAPVGPGDWTGAGALAAPNAGGNARASPNMNNFALGQQIMGGQQIPLGGGSRGAIPLNAIPRTRRPTPGGFGFNPQTQSPFGYGP